MPVAPPLPGEPRTARRFRRVAVIGTSCAGKTTFAARVARCIGARHVELDALHWGPDWTERPAEAFRRAVAEAAATERWVVDGNYRAVRDLIWPRAEAIVWLDYPFPLVFRRALLRTTRRILTGERLFGDNVESFCASFLHPDGIPWWVIRTHRRHRREYGAPLAAQAQRGAWVVRCRTPQEAETFLATLS